MYQVILSFFLLTTSLACLGQTDTPAATPVKEKVYKLNLPLPYRTLSETIGEQYIALPVDKGQTDYYFAIYKKGQSTNPTVNEFQGKKLTLISIDNNKKGLFKDSLGVEYSCEIVTGIFPDIAPISDIEDTRKMFINKKIWLKVDEISTGDPYDRNNNGILKKLKLDPVIVTDVLPNSFVNAPALFMVKTMKGETGFFAANVSDTNTSFDIKYLFSEIVFPKDPKLIYKFSPSVWSKVKIGYVTLGMPTEAVQLVEGYPRKRNITTTGKTTFEQWIYGPPTAERYFYFTNNILTSRNNSF